ncbi:MAG: Crp/Fnr family transcriptional regulator [Oscillospiraceae bacterium]|nr:Crp/Fnr family transcriptional regulator [Oscillospiraceae bacterium]
MDKYYSILTHTPLFHNLSHTDFLFLMDWLEPQIKTYQKGEIVLLAGYETHSIGVVLNGTLVAGKYTAAGADIQINSITTGGIFADILSGSHVKSPVTLTCVQAAKILFLPYQRIITPPPSSHVAYQQLLKNWIGVISDKYFALDKRMDILIEKNLRKKIALFLLSASPAADMEFSISLNRTALAHYLNCERSALSRELSRMQAAGLIVYRRNCFKILNLPALKAL